MLPAMLGASQTRVIELLAGREEELELDRKAQVNTYRAQTHIEVLSALMAERSMAA